MADPEPREGPSYTCDPVSPQNEEKYRCVSDSQCGPERFPGGGECSPFLHPTPTPIPSLHGTLKCSELSMGISPSQERGQAYSMEFCQCYKKFSGCSQGRGGTWFLPQEFSLGF